MLKNSFKSVLVKHLTINVHYTHYPLSPIIIHMDKSRKETKSVIFVLLNLIELLTGIYVDSNK